MLMDKKKIVFLTGTRADFGKLKSLISITQNSENFDVHIFVTGMHMQSEYGYTVEEIIQCGYDNVFKYINSTAEDSMDLTLAKTIEGLSNYIKEIKPDLIVIHGDRIEAFSYLSTAVITRGKIKVNKINPKYLTSELQVLKKMGCEIKIKNSSIELNANKRLKPVKVNTSP